MGTPTIGTAEVSSWASQREAKPPPHLLSEVSALAKFDPSDWYVFARAVRPLAANNLSVSASRCYSAFGRPFPSSCLPSAYREAVRLAVLAVKPKQTLEIIGAPGRVRTANPRFRRPITCLERVRSYRKSSRTSQLKSLAICRFLSYILGRGVTDQERSIPLP